MARCVLGAKLVHQFYPPHTAQLRGQRATRLRPPSNPGQHPQPWLSAKAHQVTRRRLPSSHLLFLPLGPVLGCPLLVLLLQQRLPLLRCKAGGAVGSLAGPAAVRRRAGAWQAAEAQREAPSLPSALAAVQAPRQLVHHCGVPHAGRTGSCRCPSPTHNPRQRATPVWSRLATLGHPNHDQPQRTRSPTIIGHFPAPLTCTPPTPAPPLPPHPQPPAPPQRPCVHPSP